jgi:hypothetical protein
VTATTTSKPVRELGENFGKVSTVTNHPMMKPGRTSVKCTGDGVGYTGGQMDEAAKELVKVGAEQVFGPYKDLMNKLFGGPAEQLGGMWADSLAARRRIRQVGLLKKVQAAIEEARFEPQQISDNIWLPAIAEASLQDDETIQQRWANLLANAADPRNGSNNVEPSFLAILKELTYREVKFLDALYEAVQVPATRKPRLAVKSPQQGYTARQLLSVYGADGPFRESPVPGSPTAADWEAEPDRTRAYLAGFQQTLDVLVRNNVLSLVTYAKPIKLKAKGGGFGIVSSIPKSLPIEMETVNLLTDLGWSFVRACRSPKEELSANPDDWRRGKQGHP